MRFRHAPSALTLLAMLSACAVLPPDKSVGDPIATPAAEATPATESTPAPTATPTPASKPPATGYRPGMGTIESASIVSLPSSQSAAGGGTAGPMMGYRLRMDDGTAQNVMQAGERLEVGDRVEVARDGRLMRR